MKGRERPLRDYTRLQTSDSCKIKTIFYSNGELHTHGVGAPDLGLGAYRNSVIINQLAGREVYTVSHKRFSDIRNRNRGKTAVPNG
ncbi:hypothetical protein PO124_10905 [Bacillus licheniformis]|nr:hypothetical protein [Bacillus licheniformis]